MGPIPLIFVLVFLIYLLKYFWEQRKHFQLALSLPGPPAVPLVGNGLLFLRNHDALDVLSKLTDEYKSPLRLWLGPMLLILFHQPSHLEKILSSSKMAQKHDIYDRFVKVFLGNGLVSNSGELYKKHRRLIQPLISVKFSSGNIEFLEKSAELLVSKIKPFANKGTFDVHDFIHNCCADIMGELMLGVALNAQNGFNQNYIHATTRMYIVGHSRLLKPWHHPNILYNLSQEKKEEIFITRTTTQFVRKAIDAARHRLKGRLNNSSNQEEELTSAAPIIDQLLNIRRNNPDAMNETDFLYHLYTLYVASEDTTTVIAAVLCVCLGMYPEYQKKAVEELRKVFGTDFKNNVTYEKLGELHYLDMCIRDVLRLIPIAPFIVRQPTEDFEIDNIVIPKGCGVLINIYSAHRNPEQWEKPDHFHPDHFLPEAVKNRNPFSYVPFSAGPRSCVGKILALMTLKLLMVNILSNYEIEADGKFPDFKLTTDITVRSACGYKIRLKDRVWDD